MTRVKICGITRPQDALAAAEAGAWAVGLVFCPKSQRFVTAQQALAAIAHLPKGVLRVGVFMNQSLEVIRRVEAEVPLDLIQLHGREPNEMCLEIGRERCIKAFVLNNDHNVEQAARYSCEFLMADRPRESAAAASEAEQDRWTLAEKLARKRAKTLLAGGLTPENVAEGIRAVRPWGVDASSGLESSAGIKDSKLVRAFIMAARRANGEET